MSAPLLHRLLTREECESVSLTLAHRYEQHVLNDPRPKVLSENARIAREAAAAAATDDPELCCYCGKSPCGLLALSDACQECGTAEEGPEADRVVLDRADCVVKPCPACRAERRAEFDRARQVRAWLASDLTLRCPVCSSNVEGRVDDYHCPACARSGR